MCFYYFNFRYFYHSGFIITFDNALLVPCSEQYNTRYEHDQNAISQLQIPYYLYISHKHYKKE